MIRAENVPPVPGFLSRVVLQLRVVGWIHVAMTPEETIVAVLTGVFDKEIQLDFIKRYESPLDQFVLHTATAYKRWKSLDSLVSGSIERAHISSIVYGVINNLVISMKLLLMGLNIPSGHMHRQVLEGIALALLASRRNTGVLQKYIDGKYSTQKAIPHLGRLAKKLGIDPEAVRTLQRANKFRDQFSHLTNMTLAHSMFLNPPGSLMLGGFFDEGKLEIYDKEVKSLVSLASTLCNFIEGIEYNLEQKTGVNWE